MLEIAGGVILAVIVLLLLFNFMGEILMVLGTIIKWVGALYLFLGAITLGFCLLYLGWHGLVKVLGHHLASAICEPVFGLFVCFGPIFFWMDSRDDFEMIRAAYRWAIRNFRPSALKARMSRG